MAQANLRLAAGVGVMTACLLVGGPSVAVAIADPLTRPELKRALIELFAPKAASAGK